MIENLNEQSKTIHQNNVEAGWWNCLHSGESILETRNRPEIMFLAVSELSEASEGYELFSSDDKLPHRLMAEVEIADAVIRLHDLLGAENIILTEDNYEYPNFDVRSFDECTMFIVNRLSYALEGYRRGDREKYVDGLSSALFACYHVGNAFSFDVQGAAEEKLQFNKTRADHKPENRLKSDGKKI